MSFAVRLLQLLLAFLAVQLTLKFFGEDLYIQLNKVIFVYLVSLSLVQPILNAVWKGEASLVEDVVISLTVAVIVSAFSNLEIQLVLLSIVYSWSRMLERYAYCSLLSSNRFYVGQFLVVFLHFFEIILIIGILYGGLKEEQQLFYRVFFAAAIFFIPSIIFAFFFKKSSRVSFRFFFRLKKLAPQLDVLVYFFAAILILNIDRLFVQNIKHNAASFLFSLSVAGAIFGLASVKIDKLKSNIASGRGFSAGIPVGVFLLFNLFGFSYWIGLNYILFFREFFGLSKLPLDSVLSVFFICGSVFVFMYISTPKLILSSVKLPALILMIFFVIKVLMIFFLDVSAANYVVGACLLIASFLGRKSEHKLKNMIKIKDK